MTTAILVHGGWHSASCWDLVRAAIVGVPRRVLEAGDHRRHRDLRPRAQHVRDQLPEDRHLTDFVVLWNTYKRIAADFSPDERSWVFEKAARSIYNI